MKLIPKYQEGTTRDGILDNTRINYSYSSRFRPLLVKRKSDLERWEEYRMLHDKNELIGPVLNVPEDLRERYRRRAETLLWMDQRARNFESFGNLLNLTMPSTYAGQIIGRKLTGPEALAVDLVTAPILGGIKAVGKKGVQTATKLATKGAEAYRRRFVYPREGLPQWFYTQKPLIAGGRDPYKLNLGNSTLQTTKQLTTDPLSLLANNKRYGDGYKLITVEDLLKLAEERIGRRLTTTELKDYVGHRKIDLGGEPEIGFAPSDVNGNKESVFVLEESDVPEALSNFNKFTDKNTIRTRIGKDRYSLLEIESMLDDQGRLKSNVALLRVYPGEHGKANWFDRGNDAFTRTLKYFKTKYDTGALMGIIRENPFDRSGVIIGGNDFDFSSDSFRTALEYLDRALGKKGKQFYELKPLNSHISGNNFGLKSRYKEIDFDPLFSELLKVNRGELPEGTKVFTDNAGNLRIQYLNKKVGTLRPRTNEEIIGSYDNAGKRIPGDYDELIDNLNKNYNLNIGYPRLNRFGKIEWPNIYGILYKKGGNINVSKNILLYREKSKTN